MGLRISEQKVAFLMVSNDTKFSIYVFFCGKILTYKRILHCCRIYNLYTVFFFVVGRNKASGIAWYQNLYIIQRYTRRDKYSWLEQKKSLLELSLNNLSKKQTSSTGVLEVYLSSFKSSNLELLS